jgi:predicted transcriptional regulator of viral defense system
LDILKNEFSGDYGSEIVESALDSLDIQINHKGLEIPPEPEPKPAPKGTTEKVLYVIQTSQAGISKKEICNKLSISSKTASNVMYRLKKHGKIKSVSRGVYVATHSPIIKTIIKEPPKSTVNIREEVLKTIAEYKNGVRAAKIIERTEFRKKQINNALYYLFKRGKITRIEPGLYKAV